MRKPDFNQILKVVQCQKPDRDTLFEFFLNDRLYERAIGKFNRETMFDGYRVVVKSFAYYGYDYATVHASEMGFPGKPLTKIGRTLSLNDEPTIFDRASFDQYEWIDPKKCDYSALKNIEAELPNGMKLMVMGPGGVLENVISLVGYDNLCYMLYEDEQLVEDIFEQVGSRLNEYYKIAAEYKSVGMLISNDDWGFDLQTMLSVKHLRKYVFPWHKEIVKTIHASGKPALLHSCGNFTEIIDDLYDMGYDARHSYEDKAIPVEKAYEMFKGKMAVLGGIDVNFLCTASVDEIKNRSKKLLELSREHGGYALGSGNSIPDYVPDESYLAMISVIND